MGINCDNCGRKCDEENLKLSFKDGTEKYLCLPCAMVSLENTPKAKPTTEVEKDGK